MTAPIGNAAAPPGSGASLGADDDAMSALYTTLSEARQDDLTVGESRVEDSEVQQQQDEAQQRAAIQREQANQPNAGGGFLSEVGDFVSDVASDLVHGRFGSAVDDAGRDLANAWNSPKFWSDLKTGLEDIAIVATAVAATVTTAGVGGVAIAAATVSAVAAGGAGLASARVDHFEATAEDASAEATSAGDGAQAMQELATDVLADLKQTDQSHERALESLTQSIQIHDQTLVTASSMTVKG
jgi:hypothetical protein